MQYTMSIAGTEVKVTFMPPDVEALKSEDDSEDADGDYDTRTHEIRIVTANKTEDQLKSALVHEIIHAIFGISGFWQHLQGIDESIEELICANLQSFLSPLIDIKEEVLMPVKPKRKRKKSK